MEQLPAIGISGALVLVIGYLLASNFRDRVQHEKALAARDQDHATDLLGLQARITALERRLGELEVELDRERTLRRKAEDAAAQALRGYPNPPS